MNSLSYVLTIDAPPVCKKEIIRYTGEKNPSNEFLKLIDDCLNESLPLLTYKTCYCVTPIEIRSDNINFEGFSVISKDLAKNLKDSTRGIIFASTIGTGIDRLINKYNRISPVKALILQGIGAERVEALCDAFCCTLEKEKSLNFLPRFSPGYGDLSLNMQKDIFRILDCSNKIGLTLNESLIMSPSKSVTAIMGVTNKNCQNIKMKKCSNCNKIDCQFRSSL